MKEMKDEPGDIIKMTPSTYQISGHTDSSSSTFLKVINQQNLLEVPIFNKKKVSFNFLSLVSFLKVFTEYVYSEYGDLII